jgi:phage gpG-like protein
MAGEIQLHDQEAQFYLKKLSKKFEEIKNSDQRYGALLTAVVFQDIMDHFKQEEGSEGPWAEWSKRYQEQMEKKGKGGNKILQDTGHLRQSFRQPNYRSVKEGILWFNPAKTKQGFPYAAAHDTGGPRLPQRDFMWLSQEGVEKISEQTLKFLEDL